MKRKTRLAGPARKYRRRAAARHKTDVLISRSPALAHLVLRLGCHDAVAGQKNAYKPAARGYTASYREGYKICDAIVARRRLTSEEARVVAKHDLEFEVKLVQQAQRSPRR
jgi:hypothetical protein